LTVAFDALYFARQLTDNGVFMSQSNAATNTNDENETHSFSKQAPIVLYDNGHGLRVKRWPDGVSNLMIENSYKPKDAKDYVTQTLNVTPEQALGIIFGLHKGVEQSMDKVRGKGQGRG
jgi:hypothetical protein